MLTIEYSNKKLEEITVDQFPIVFGRNPESWAHWDQMHHDKTLETMLFGKFGDTTLARYALETYENRKADIKITKSSSVSKVHFIIRKKPGSELEYQIMDMGSSGTHANDHRLRPLKWYNLPEETTLSLGKGPRREEVIIRSKHSEKNIAYLLINPENDDFHRTYFAEHTLAPELRLRGFKVIISKDYVGSNEVRNNFRKIKKEMGNSGNFFFYYSGHGKRDCTLKLEDGAFDFEDIFKEHGKFARRQLYIFDTCHSGDFTRTEYKPANATVFSSVKNRDATSQRFLLGGKFVEFLRQNPHTIKFDQEYFKQLESKLYNSEYRQKPAFNPGNSTFFMNSITD